MTTKDGRGPSGPRAFGLLDSTIRGASQALREPKRATCADCDVVPAVQFGVITSESLQVGSPARYSVNKGWRMDVMQDRASDGLALGCPRCAGVMGLMEGRIACGCGFRLARAGKVDLYAADAWPLLASARQDISAGCDAARLAIDGLAETALQYGLPSAAEERLARGHDRAAARWKALADLLLSDLDEPAREAEGTDALPHRSGEKLRRGEPLVSTHSDHGNAALRVHRRPLQPRCGRSLWHTFAVSACQYVRSAPEAAEPAATLLNQSPGASQCVQTPLAHA